MWNGLNGKKIKKYLLMFVLSYIIVLIPFLILFYNNLPDIEGNFATIPETVEFLLSPSGTGVLWACLAGILLSLFINRKNMCLNNGSVSIKKLASSYKKWVVIRLSIVSICAVIAILIVEQQVIYNIMMESMVNVCFYITGLYNWKAGGDVYSVAYISTVFNSFSSLVLPTTEKVLDMLAMYVSYEIIRILFDKSIHIEQEWKMKI